MSERRVIKTSKAEVRVAHVIGLIIHLILWPARLAGLFGTANRPKFYEEGDAIPPWVALHHPHCMVCLFACEVAVYYSFKSGRMRVEQQEPGGPIVNIDSPPGILLKGGLFLGAPTMWCRFDGMRRRKPSENMALSQFDGGRPQSSKR